MRTGGRLATRRDSPTLADLARVHISNAVGRLSLLAHLNPGRNAYVAPARLVPAGLGPDPRSDRRRHRRPCPHPCSTTATAPTSSAAPSASSKESTSTPSCCTPPPCCTTPASSSPTDATTSPSPRPASPATSPKQVGLSTAATDTLQTAITMHHSPRVTLTAGPVAYLLSAGAGVDVVGVRCWELPRATLTATVRDHPREGFQDVLHPSVGGRSSPRPRGPGAPPAPVRRVHCRHRLAPFDE